MSMTPQSMSKRGRLRRLFTSSFSLPTSSTPTTAQTALRGSAGSGNPSAIPTNALETSAAKDRNTVRNLQPANVIGIDAAIAEAYTYASELQQLCAKTRWSWNYKGRELYVSDQVDRIAHFLDGFKSVRDVVANADPVHVGLPWAEVWAMFEVTLPEGTKRAVSVTGMELSLYMSNRLEVYLKIYAHAPLSPALANFRQALVDMCRYLLNSLAQAIRERHAPNTAKALWGSEDLLRCKAECDKLCLKAIEEARLRDGENLVTRPQSLQEIHHLKANLTELSDRADLDKLITAKEATYDSSAEGDLPRCLPGTQTDLLRRINTWTADPLGRRILWISGRAGIGKSTISRTVAEALDKDGRLAASFFFKRGRADRSPAKLFFPTIAKQLVDKVPDLRHAIASALEKDTSLCKRHIKKQFDGLLLQPFQSNLASQALLEGYFLVIDALDECEKLEQVESLLKLLKRLEDVTRSRLRILVTSRPGPPLIQGCRPLSSSLLREIQFEDAQVEPIWSDLEIFFNHGLAQIGTRYPRLNPFGSLPTDWAKPHDIKLLVNKSHPLFIVAFTICKILSSSKERQEDLRQILSQTDGHGDSTGLEFVYLFVLRRAVATISGEGTTETLALLRTIVGSLVLLYNPLSATSLSKLLGTSMREIRTFIAPLRSILNVPELADGTPDPLGAIKLFHVSFRDFLVDPNMADDDKSERFWIDKAQAHKQLASHCLRLLSEDTLVEDVCRVKAPGTRRAAISQATIAEHLPEEVAYACSYWVQHVMESRECLKDDGDVHRFLKVHLLHWIEALSWLGKTSEVIRLLGSLRWIVNEPQGRQLSDMLDDASRFTLHNRDVIDEAPLQLYTSALDLAPTRSIIRQTFGDVPKRHLDMMSNVSEHWDVSPCKLLGYRDYVSSVAFSSDGRILASGSDDKTVRLHDAEKGYWESWLRGHEDHVSSVAFSPDSKVVASASWDKTVRIWNARASEQLRKLEGHEGYVYSVAFSPGGQVVASASEDKSVRLWNVETGEQLQKLEGHEDIVSSVVFSPGGQIVISASRDKTIRLWDPQTGKQVRRLEGHEDYVSSVACSPDGRVLAPGSDDKTVRLWDVQKGEQVQKLGGHEGPVFSVTFSPGGQLVASASGDMTVRLWDAKTGEQLRRLEGHEDCISSVAFSPDGRKLASGSDDETVRLWDMNTVTQASRWARR